MKFPINTRVRKINHKGQPKIYRILDNEKDAIACWFCNDPECLELESVASVNDGSLVHYVSECTLERVQTYAMPEPSERTEYEENGPCYTDEEGFETYGS